MRDRPGSTPMRFTARQTINLRRTTFTWRASIGPFGCISVLDALDGADPRLEVRFLGLRVAGATNQPPLLKGEVMRYLAELAWAPDAILLNPALIWTVIDAQTMQVAAETSGVRAAVTITLDSDGRIVAISAPGRPRKEGNTFVERPWRGRFLDYRRHQDRWLPFAAEVSWELEDQTFITWQGTILDWAMT